MMIKFITTIIVSFLIIGCASTSRVHFTKGEDDGSKIARIVISSGLVVTSIDSENPPNTAHFSNGGNAGGMNKIFNLLPGKHKLEVGFRSFGSTSTSTLPLAFDAKAGDIVFLCYDVDQKTKNWKPRVYFAPAEKVTTEEVMGLYNLYLTEGEDRKKCSTFTN